MLSALERIEALEKETEGFKKQSAAIMSVLMSMNNSHEAGNSKVMALNQSVIMSRMVHT